MNLIGRIDEIIGRVPHGFEELTITLYDADSDDESDVNLDIELEGMRDTPDIVAVRIADGFKFNGKRYGDGKEFPDDLLPFIYDDEFEKRYKRSPRKAFEEWILYKLEKRWYDNI